MRLLDLLSDPVRLPLALAAATVVGRVLYAILSRVVAPHPRLRALVEALAAASPDVIRAALQVVALVTGRPAPKLDALPPDPRVEERAARLAGSDLTLLRATVLDLQTERDALARRVAELTAAEEPGRRRPTVVPGEEPGEEPARSPDETTVSGRRRLPPGTLGTMALLVALTGCPQVIREPAVPAPPPGCDGGASVCNRGAPFVCGPGGQWSQADRACAGLGDAGTLRCCATPSALRPGVLVHACVPSNLCVEAAR